MRWFIVFLIVANVILFFWVQQESRPRPADVRLPPPDVGRLRLLTEMRSPPTGEEAQSADRPAGELADPGPAADAMASYEAEPALAPVQVDTSGEAASEAVGAAEVVGSGAELVADPAVPDKRAPVAEKSAAVVDEAAGNESRDGAPDARFTERSTAARTTSSAPAIMCGLSPKLARYCALTSAGAGVSGKGNMAIKEAKRSTFT